MVVLRKLHPHGGDRCDRKRCQVRACAGAQKRDLARSRMTMTCPLPGSVDGWLGVEDETGPCNGVKGAVDAYDPPLEARVPRLDGCCLKQKVGYSRDTAPKNNYRASTRPLSRREVESLRPPPLIENIFCPALLIGESSRSGRGLGLISFWDKTLNCRAVS